MNNPSEAYAIYDSTTGEMWTTNTYPTIKEAQKRVEMYSRIYDEISHLTIVSLGVVSEPVQPIGYGWETY